MMRAPMLALTLIVGCPPPAAAGGDYPPEHGHVCEHGRGCPPAPCFDAACDGPGVCNYTRQGLAECCLTNDECCSIAPPGTSGVCGKDCTCEFFRDDDGQCASDADCDGFLSGLLCRAQGPCFHPYCVTPAGQCDCLDGTGLDLDGDNETCPQDCDDLDPAVCARITCYRDGDSDDYLDCDAHNTTTECRKLCIEPGRTCPPGWSDPTDPHAPQKHRSDVDPDTGTPCPNIAIHPPAQCDCCDADPVAYPGSLHAANGLNGCGQPDYNCNGMPDRLACCSNGYQHPDSGTRTLWFAPSCESDERPNGVGNSACGSCVTEANDVAWLRQGWACEEECPLEPVVISLPETQDGDVEAETAAELLQALECPASCEGRCDCVLAASETPWPELGRCAKWVHDCVGIRTNPEGEVTLYGESEDCCASVVL